MNRKLAAGAGSAADWWKDEKKNMTNEIYKKISNEILKLLYSNNLTIKESKNILIYIIQSLDEQKIYLN